MSNPEFKQTPDIVRKSISIPQDLVHGQVWTNDNCRYDGWILEDTLGVNLQTDDGVRMFFPWHFVNMIRFTMEEKKEEEE